MELFYNVRCFIAERVLDADDRCDFSADSEVEVRIFGWQVMIAFVIGLGAVLVLDDEMVTSDENALAVDRA